MSGCTGKVSVVRLRFTDQGLERLYEDPHAVLPGADGSVTEYFFDTLAVLRAARSLADFSELRAFAALPIDGQPGERRELPSAKVGNSSSPFRRTATRALPRPSNQFGEPPARRGDQDEGAYSAQLRPPAPS